MARAHAALAKEKEKASKVNTSVPKEAQDLFAAIGRQLPTRWNGNDIVVMDQVVVKGPGYGSGDCRAAKNVVAGTLERVRKVVSLSPIRYAYSTCSSLLTIRSRWITSARSSRNEMAGDRNLWCLLCLLFPHLVAGRGREVEKDLCIKMGDRLLLRQISA